jgi:hypothetical protein
MGVKASTSKSRFFDLHTSVINIVHYFLQSVFSYSQCYREYRPARKKIRERFHVLEIWGTYPSLFVEAVKEDVSPEPQFMVFLWELKPSTSRG